jgi:putative ABC transport system permease protein
VANLLGDVRYGLRMFVKRPGLSALAVVALALGIGLTTTMFSIVYVSVLKGLPYEQADRLIAIFRTRPAQTIEFLPVDIHDFTDWRAQQKSFDALGAYYAETVNVSGSEGQPIRYLGAYASANLFDILRVRPILGRTFRPTEDAPSAPPVMILSYRSWQDRFNGDPNVIGQMVRANSEMTTIVGVMPERFSFPSQMDAWLPLRIDPLAFQRGSGPALESTQLQAIGRLRDGVSMETAQAEMSLIAKRIADEYPASNEGIGVRLVSQTDMFIGPEGRAFLWTMLGAVFGVLLIACANVANLLLARTARRTKEIAIRTALGAGRIRTISQLLAETLVLAVAGAVAGLLVAKIGIDFFNAAIATAEMPLWFVASFEPAVVGFVLVLTGLSAILAGTAPAVRASSSGVSEILNDEARGSSGLRLGRISKALVVGQLALSCGLLVASGLMIKTIVNIARFDYGYSTSNLYTARLGLFAKDYPTPVAQRQFYDRARERVEALPGVKAVAFGSDLPGRGSSQMQRLSVDGTPYPTEQDHPRARRVVITPRYFDLFDVRPLRGRAVTQADAPGSLPVAIVNQRFVGRFLGRGDPLGRRVRLGDDAEPWRTVVGVVPDMHLGGAIGQLNPQDEGVYVPLAQNVINFMSLLVRTDRAPLAHASAIQGAINEIDPTLPLYWVRSLDDQYRLDTTFYRLFGTLFTAFGFAALALGVVGLYGVMSFSVGNRIREIGVRMALGAQARDVRRMILRQGAIQIAIGVAIGLALAALLSRGLGILLFGVKPWDPAVFMMVVGALTAAGLAACLVPARRATRVDPIAALRYE